MLFWDNGLYTAFAQTLTRYFGHVWYYMPWQDGFPDSNEQLPGWGLPGLSRVKYAWDVVPDADLIVFPDIYHADEQLELRRQGKRVWGAGWAETLETDRIGTKELLQSLGLPVGHYEVVQGLDNLRHLLKAKQNLWVKINETRGDMETFHHVNYAITEPRLDDLEQKLGPKKQIMQFIVEDDISPAIEVGFDGWTIDGQFPDPCFFGFEIKDKGFIGGVKPYRELAEPIQRVNAELSLTFKEHGFRGFWSSELRITPDGEPYLIDPCPRAPSPPNEVEQEIFNNWGDILWQGADGRIVAPRPVAKFGVVIMLHSLWAVKHWTPLGMPEDMLQWFKIRYLTRIRGRYYFTPQAGQELPEIGGVIGLGDTIDEAVAAAEQHAEKLEAYDVEAQAGALDEALAEIEKAKQYGITL